FRQPLGHLSSDLLVVSFDQVRTNLRRESSRGSRSGRRLKSRAVVLEQQSGEPFLKIPFLGDVCSLQYFNHARRQALRELMTGERAKWGFRAGRFGKQRVRCDGPQIPGVHIGDVQRDGSTSACEIPSLASFYL